MNENPEYNTSNEIDTIPESSSNTIINLFSNTNALTIILIILLLLSFLGINLLFTSGNILQQISDLLKPVIYNFLSIFGYTTGTVINATADIAADASKLGIDLAEGSVKNIGNLLKKSGEIIDINKKNDIELSIFNLKSYMDRSPTQPPTQPATQPPTQPATQPATQPPTQPPIVTSIPTSPAPIETSHPIQTGESSSTNKWCLIGEYQNKRGCIELSDHDKCMSGQVFPTQKMCLNPTFTPNM